MYRKRFIPMETIDISKDEVVLRTSSLIVTKWLPIHKREDIASGMSWTYLEDGYKISKFFDKDGNLLYYYCDIIDVDYNEEEDVFTFVDLLVDVKVFPDGKLEFLDFDELQVAFNKKLIDSNQLLMAINHLNKLVQKINERGIEALCLI
jgi:predicted RNA-binding protein associated with RNAse of E/G family